MTAMTGQGYAIIDWTVLSKIVGTNSTMRDRLLTLFVADLESDLLAVQAAAERCDIEAVHKFAHRLCGAAKTVGAGSLSSAAQSLENFQGSDRTGLARLVSQLEQAAAAVNEAIRGAQGVV